MHLDGTEALPRDVDAAAVAGGHIVLDLAGVQSDRGVGSHFMDNANAAAVFGGVTADLAAIDVELAAVQSYAAALLQAGVAGKRTAVEIDDRQLRKDAAALVAARASADCAAAGAVTDVQHREGLVLRSLKCDRRLGLIRAGEAVAVEAQGQMLPGLQRQVGRNIPRQINVCNAVGIADLARAVPRLISNIRMTGMVTDGNVAAADAMRVSKPQDQVDRRTILNMIIRQRFAFLKLLAVQGQPLLRQGDALSFLNFYLHRKDGIRRLYIKRDRLSGKGFDE